MKSIFKQNKRNKQDNDKTISNLYNISYNKTINIYFLNNSINNLIETKLTTSFKKLFTSKEFSDYNFKLIDNVDHANCIIFMLSENFTEDNYHYLKYLPNDIVKIGIITSSAKSKYTFGEIDNLILITQPVNATISESQLKQAMGINSNIKLMRLPISPLINKTINDNVHHAFKLNYARFTAEIGLYEIMTLALPDNYSSLEIICPNNEIANQLKNTFIYNTNIIVLNNKCIINYNIDKDEAYIKRHSMLKLFKIIYQSCTRNV